MGFSQDLEHSDTARFALSKIPPQYFSQEDGDDEEVTDGDRMAEKEETDDKVKAVKRMAEGIA